MALLTRSPQIDLRGACRFICESRWPRLLKGRSADSPRDISRKTRTAILLSGQLARNLNVLRVGNAVRVTSRRELAARPSRKNHHRTIKSLPRFASKRTHPRFAFKRAHPAVVATPSKFSYRTKISMKAWRAVRGGKLTKKFGRLLLGHLFFFFFPSPTFLFPLSGFFFLFSLMDFWGFGGNAQVGRRGLLSGGIKDRGVRGEG